MDSFAQHVLEEKVNSAPGEMGKIDMNIIEATYNLLLKLVNKYNWIKVIWG